ncbi:MAG TPA: histidine kinase, partial [Burkholderiaceae bacterium]
DKAPAVDLVVGGQHVRIGVPANADADDVKEAIASAKDAIVEQLKQQEKDRERADRAAARAAARAKSADADADADDDGGDADSDSDDVDSDGNRSTVRTHTVHYGEMLPLLAVWWVLGSLLLKITYKGRMQAEVKAAAATETAEAESLRRQVLEAKMAMMQAQVEPHFLFNTLASIDHLIEFDPKRASQMQRNLISLLRASMPSMRSTDSGLRPLDLELAVVRPYLEILKVRMEERLTTEIDVPDGLLSAEFPPMMIQTLVENSIKHGLEPKAEGGHLSVKAEIRHGKLAVTVADTGLGFEAAAQGTTHGTGVGLSNIRERLALLYGAKASLSIANNPVGGTIVTITVPYTAHAESAEGAPA